MDILAASCGAYRYSRSALSGFERQPVLAHVAAPMVRARSYLPLFRSTLKPIPNPGLDMLADRVIPSIVKQAQCGGLSVQRRTPTLKPIPNPGLECSLTGLSRALLNRPNVADFPTSPPKTDNESWPGMLADRIIPGIVKQAQCGRLPDQHPTLKPIPNLGLDMLADRVIPGIVEQVQYIFAITVLAAAATAAVHQIDIG